MSEVYSKTVSKGDVIGSNTVVCGGYVSRISIRR